MHGMVMVFFFLIPVVPAVLGNFLVPLMIGAKDLAFPRINLLSWYLYVIGGILITHVMLTGGVNTAGLSTPRSARTIPTPRLSRPASRSSSQVFSSIFTGLNFIVTIHRMRAPGLTWDRLPLFIWANYATSLIMILGTPVVAITIVLVAVERLFQAGAATGIFLVVVVSYLFPIDFGKFSWQETLLRFFRYKVLPHWGDFWWFRWGIVAALVATVAALLMNRARRGEA